MGGGISSSKITKTVVVLGAAYGGRLSVFITSQKLSLLGAHAAQVIAAGLPEGWTLYLIDRNTWVCFPFDRICSADCCFLCSHANRKLIQPLDVRFINGMS